MQTSSTRWERGCTVRVVSVLRRVLSAACLNMMHTTPDI